VRPVLVRQHGDITPPGILEDWLRRRGIAFEVQLSYDESKVPDPADYAFVASLGSACSPNDVHMPAVVREIELIQRAVDSEVPVLGLCFGGEVLSTVLGGRVERSPEPELGWREIQTDDPSIVPPGPWLEWHYDSFTTPPGAQEIARTETAPQAFRIGPHLGVQFHPESTVEIVSGWAALDTERLAEMGVEDWGSLLEAPAELRRAARSDAFELFDAFASTVAAHRDMESAGGTGGKE